VSAVGEVAEARLALGRRLASLRQEAGLTQVLAGARIGYSRSAVARAEATGVCSRDFCRLAGQLYGAADELALAHDQIAALATAARSQAARHARRNHQPGPAAAVLSADNDVTFSAVAAACPHCGKPVAMLVRHSAVLMPLETPGTHP
jgi:transcriptional regulator with XRE-family HTH domain